MFFVSLELLGRVTHEKVIVLPLRWDDFEPAIYFFSPEKPP
jgi:hypothetical protein